MAKNGRLVGQRAQLVDRHHAGMLELAADLRLLDEPVDQVGPLAVLVEQDLQRQVAAEGRVAAPEHSSHPAPGDLAEELVSAGRSIDLGIAAIRSRSAARGPDRSGRG